MNSLAEELRALSDGDLGHQLEEAHKELFTLRFRLATRQMANTSELRKARRKVARIITLIRERELGA